MRVGIIKTFAMVVGLVAGLAGTAKATIADAAHPDFSLTEVPFAAKYKTMGLNFLMDGRMVLAVIDYIGGGDVPLNPSAGTKVLLVTGYNSTNPSDIKVDEISNTWLQLAGATVANDKLYVSDRDGFYEIPELDSPADITKNRKLIVKWPDEGTWNTLPFRAYMWHQWGFTPFFYKGNFYTSFSGSIRDGGPSDANATSHMTGAFLKWDLSGKLETYAGGLRSPNGTNVDPATGDMFVCDNQGSWLPSSTFAQMKPGKFYGHRQSPPHAPNWAESLPYEPPTAWLPHGEVRASPTQPVVISKGKYAGDWLMGDINNPGLVRVALDKVDGTYNGAVFFFSKGTKNAAIQRLAWGPDGALYMACVLTIAGNWPGGNDQGIFRLAPKANATVFEMKAVRSLADGLEVEFTQPVDPTTVTKAAFTAVKQWQYIRQAEYGQGRQPDQNLTVSDVEVSADNLRVHLKIAGLVKDRVVHFKHVGITSGGKAPWNDETWFTHNSVSTRAWSATVATREIVAKVNRSGDDVFCRKDSRHLLSVTVKASAPWTAVLVSPQGSVVARQSGIGFSQFQMDGGSHSGLHLVKVDMQSGSIVRKVML